MYKIVCKECRDEGRDTKYIGETSRNLYQRSLEHEKLLRKKDLPGKNEEEESVLWTHSKEDHNGEIPEYIFKVKEKHKSAFYRQISEGMNILNHNKKTKLLNRKTEFNAAKIPTLEV